MHGPQDIGKVETVAKAVSYATEHVDQVRAFEPAVRDGAYLIDLNSVRDMREILIKIIDRL